MTHEQLLKCPECDYTTNRNYNLKRHVSGVHYIDICKNDDTYTNEKNVISGETKVISGETIVIPQENIVICETLDKENVDETKIMPSEIVDVNSITTLYNCKKCNKSYKTKSSFIKHEKCCKIIDNLTCPRCMMYFSNRHNKARHIKRNNCKPRSIIHARLPILNITKKTDDKVLSMDTLKKTDVIQTSVDDDSKIERIDKIDKIDQHNLDQIAKNINNYNAQIQNSSHCTQNLQYTQNVVINNYGSERMDYLDFERYMKIFQSTYDIPSAMTKEIHFNVEFPENQNIKYNNEKTVLIKTEDKFIYKDLHNLVEELIKDKSRMIQEFAAKNKHDICNSLSHELYEKIIDLLLKLVLIKEPSTQYKRQVSLIIDMIRNTKLETKMLLAKTDLSVDVKSV